MNLLVLANSHLDCNTGIHIVSVARGLAALGVDCTICVPDESDVADSGPVQGLRVLSLDDVLRLLPRSAPDLILMWTPRECNRRALEAIRSRHRCPYVVHFEDNEFHLTQVQFRLSAPALAAWRSRHDDARTVPDHLSDPSQVDAIVGASSGITGLVTELLEVAPPGLPRLEFWPGYDESLPWGMDADLTFRGKLGISADEYVVAYTGNLHPANRQEIHGLYLAVALLNRRGLRVRLVRTGQSYGPLTDIGAELLERHAVELGIVARTDLPRVLSIADVLVQPGRPDDFNIYRFPSKLPEFFASRRPVVLPRCNIGHHLEDGHDAIVMPQCTALEIAVALEDLLPDAGRRLAIGQQGALFAERHLRWPVAARKLLPFLQRAAGAAPPGETPSQVSADEQPLTTS